MTSNLLISGVSAVTVISPAASRAIVKTISVRPPGATLTVVSAEP